MALRSRCALPRLALALLVFGGGGVAYAQESAAVSSDTNFFWQFYGRQ